MITSIARQAYALHAREADLHMPRRYVLNNHRPTLLRPGCGHFLLDAKKNTATAITTITTTAAISYPI